MEPMPAAQSGATSLRRAATSTSPPASAGVMGKAESPFRRIGIALLAAWYSPQARSTPDQEHAADQESDADHARQIGRALGEAHPAEVIERHRGEHLAGDEERDEGCCPELRHEKDGEADE